MTKGMCGAHARPKPCQSCVTAATKNKIAWQTEQTREKHRIANTHQTMAWFEDEIAIARAKAGFYQVNDIVQMINEVRKKYGLPLRKPVSISSWAQSNGVSLQQHPSVYSLYATLTVFGISPVTMERWLRLEYIHARTWGKLLIFDESELIEFVRTHTWLVDVERIKPGPIKTMAELVNRRDPWLRTVEFAKLVPVRPDMVIEHIRRGVITAEKRPGHNQPYMIRVSEIPALREALINRKFINRHQLFYARWGNTIAA